jgi:hypothetical protein
VLPEQVGIIRTHVSKSDIGSVPYGEKKNQDRCISITNYRGNADEVSTFSRITLQP